MNNAVIYARYSSHSQTEQSIEGQIRVCKEYAERNGYTILNEYIDRAMTGTNANRPAFQKWFRIATKKNLIMFLSTKSIGLAETNMTMQYINRNCNKIE